MSTPDPSRICALDGCDEPVISNQPAARHCCHQHKRRNRDRRHHAKRYSSDPVFRAKKQARNKRTHQRSYPRKARRRSALRKLERAARGKGRPRRWVMGWCPECSTPFISRDLRQARYCSLTCKRLVLLRRRHAERRAYIDSLKLARGCVRCGRMGPAKTLHFHHRDPEAKGFGISKATTISLARLHAEIAKCDVLCADCHRDHHRDDLGQLVRRGLAAQ